MNSRVKDKFDGWEISFNRNVHMYCHALSVKKGARKFSIDCEDLPTHEKTIGIWLYNLKAPDEIKRELQSVLLKWANQFKVKFKIYVSRDEFCTNSSGAGYRRRYAHQGISR